MDLNFRYELPDRNHLMGFMHTLYAEAKADVKKQVKELQFISITCDNWTSISNDGYTAVTAHGITDDWQLKEYTIAVQNIQVIKILLC